MINGALLHLSINHIPVVGFPICFLLLLAGNMRRSKDLVQAGYVGIVLIALITFPAWKSGAAAAHILHGYPNVVRETIHEHAEAADGGAVAAGVLGAVALLGWWLSRRPEGEPKFVMGLTLLGVFGVSIWMGYVAHLGGLIRHPEIEAGAPAAPPASSTMMMAPKK